MYSIQIQDQIGTSNMQKLVVFYGIHLTLKIKNHVWAIY